ncbi:MAG: SdrD B-like domain-containing protein, partial [Sediminibacterium sp.]
MLCILVLFFAVQANAQISGTVFRDFNANGTRNTGAGYNEPLVDGITVKAYDAANALVATTTTVSGAYSFSAGQIAPGTKVRLEFTGWAAGIDYPGAYGTNNKSSIQFATAPATGLGFGINYPGDYIDAPDARIIIPSYANGNNQIPGAYPAAAAADNTYAFSYGSGAAASVISDMGQIGAVWATAYHRKADKIFYAAFVKRHVSLGPLGINGLYVTNGAKTINNKTNTGTFVNLNAINPAFDAGSLTGRTFAPGNQDKTQANRDDMTVGNVFDEVGKKGMGGMAISDDGRYLYVINLNDRKLWRVDIGLTGTAPNSISQIVSYNAFPVLAGNSTFRPFAVKFYRGDIYVGGVLDGVKPDNSSVDRNELKAIVLKVNASVTPGTETFTTVLDAPLTYQRKANMNTGFGVNKNSNYVDPNGTIAAATLCQGSWHPWARTFTEVVIPPGSNKIIYPQPMFSSLDFDPADGSMILGITDRTGHQSGNENLAPTSMGNNTLYTSNAAGDILKAANNGSYTSFTLESNGTSGSLTTNGAGNNEGPGGGEFFFTDRFEDGQGGALGIGNTANGSNPSTSHEETSTGSIAMYPGKELIATSFDPITTWYTGGIRYYSTQDGIAKNGKVLYQGQYVEVFGKANGLGDIEIISAPAPIELGNRIWLDADGNGIQDPGENPIAGVTVELVKAGLVIASATTDADGNYIFSSDPLGVTTASNIYNIVGLTANTAFTIRIPNVTGGSKQAALGVNDLTTANTAGGSNADEIDSDGVLAGNNAEVTLTTGVAGANDHSFDFGFSTAVPGGGGGGLESKSLGDAVGKRVFNKAVNSQQGPVNYSKMPAVENRIIQNQIKGVGTSLTLSELLPKQIKGTNFKAFTTTPADIPSITNATDVLSIDFVLNDQAKAVSFATRTQGEVYDHTKAICDRLKGSELMSIENVTINNIKFVRYNLKNSLGQIEYAMSFAVGAKSGRLNYTIQSNWLNRDYTADEVMYNVQLWAVSPELVMNMANDIVTRLKATMPVIEQVNSIVLPKTYVTKGKREAENLVLNIVNYSSFTNGYIEIQEKANELSTSLITRQVPFTVGA